MGFYFSNRGKVVSDFESYYLTSCQATLDLYRDGILAFYTNDCSIPMACISTTNNIVTIDSTLLPSPRALLGHFVDTDYTTQIKRRTGKCIRSIYKLCRSVETCDYSSLDESFSNATNYMILLMATSNFVKTFIDIDDSMFIELLSNLKADEVDILISQPSCTPFLRTLELGTLKYLYKRWDFGRFFEEVAFLKYMDPSDLYLSINELDKFANDFLEPSQDPSAKYIKLKESEQGRKRRIIELRNKALRTSHFPKELNIFFMSLDIEEARHYWQARYTKEFCKCCMLIGQSFTDTSIQKLRDLLKEI